MVKIDVHGMKEIQAALKKLPDQVRAKALTAGINKTAEKGRAEMTRAITAEFNIKAQAVRSALDLRRSSMRTLEVTAILRAFGSRRRKGRSLNLIHFAEQKLTMAEHRRRQKQGTQKAVRFKIKKQGGLKVIDGAFIANKGRTIFIREPGAKRLPIRPVQALDVPQMFNTRRINQRVMQRINRELPIEINRAINAVLKGLIK